jgi:hypothetical protein
VTRIYHAAFTRSKCLDAGSGGEGPRIMSYFEGVLVTFALHSPSPDLARAKNYSIFNILYMPWSVMIVRVENLSRLISLFYFKPSTPDRDLIDPSSLASLFHAMSSMQQVLYCRHKVRTLNPKVA